MVNITAQCDLNKIDTTEDYSRAI